MEIVIENQSPDPSSGSATAPSPSPLFSAVNNPHPRQYRAAYVTADGVTSPVADFYTGNLQPSRPRSRLVSPEPDFESPIPTSVRRVDRSGLLEIADPEPQQRSSSRQRHQTGPDSHPGTLTRRIDRSGLLEAVPELPDQCPVSNGWRTPEEPISSTIADRKLTGAEPTKREDSSPRRSTDNRLEPPSADPRSRPSPTSIGADSITISSPYLRRYPIDSPASSVERPTPVAVTSVGNPSRNSFTCLSPSATKFLPIDATPSRGRQSYVDLTGATYTRSISDSPMTMSSANSNEIGDRKPDCVGRSSPRSRSDRQSPLTMSAIPDVIEAHGSRVGQQRSGGEKDNAPEGERAEAEGCEHSAGESLEETRVTFKGTNKILHNDNIQTLRVIILSEQL